FPEIGTIGPRHVWIDMCQDTARISSSNRTELRAGSKAHAAIFIWWRQLHNTKVEGLAAFVISGDAGIRDWQVANLSGCVALPQAGHQEKNFTSTFRAYRRIVRGVDAGDKNPAEFRLPQFRPQFCEQVIDPQRLPAATGQRDALRLDEQSRQRLFTDRLHSTGSSFLLERYNDSTLA